MYMFLLQLERGKYLRVCKGVTAKQIERTFEIPVIGEVCKGMIVEIGKQKRFKYAIAGESFKSLAESYGCDEAELKEINGGIIYPTKRIWIP